MRLLCFDFETELMGEGKVIPPPVALAIQDTETNEQMVLVGMDEMREGIEYMLGEDAICVAHNLAFDACVAARAFPDLASAIFDAVESGQWKCTVIREKLVYLTTNGETEYCFGQKLGYKLSECVMRRLGFEMGDKEAEDSWRLHYIELKDIPFEEWPQDAKEYILLDVLVLPDLFMDQQRSADECEEARGYSCFAEETFRNTANMCLFFMSSRGFAIDKAEKARIESWLAEELKPERLALITFVGILRPAVPPRPYKNGAKDADGNPKMVKGEPESRNMDVLREYVLLMHRDMPDDVAIRYTEPSNRFPQGQLQVDREWLDEHDHLDPVIEEYSHRQSLQKYVTTELPRMCREDGTSADIVHPSFDVLKKTGRTSSYATKIYPSFNCQNVMAKVRNCFVARDGYWMFSLDYSQMELGTWAQKCLDVLGFSVMADIINEGIGPHEFLGAQMAYKFEPMFREHCEEQGLTDPTKMEIYEEFYALKNSTDPKWAKYHSEEVNGETQYKSIYKHFRTYAKPTGLGYPGGLGAKTFIKYSKATYGIIVDLQQSKDFFEVWSETFPEGPAWRNYVSKQCIDPYHKGKDEDTGRPRNKYIYTTPFGLVRPNADFCAVANGAGLQAPSANGALLALNRIMRECEIGDLKGKAFPMGFIHDEFVGEVKADPETAGPILSILADIMVESMMVVTPDVCAAAEPAMMLRWDKRAEPAFNDKGQLIPWEPEVKA